MAFKPVNTQATDIKKHLNKPFTGEYKGVTKITTKIGDQLVYNFLDDNGLPYGIYGFTNLNRTMEHVEPGTVCRITYTGTVKVQTKFGLKDVHQVLVEIDDGELPEVREKPEQPEQENNDLPF